MLYPGAERGSSRPRTGVSGPRTIFAHKCNDSNANNQDVRSAVDPGHKKSEFYNSEPLLKQSPFKAIILGKKLGPSP